jgi:putative sterol carrier protein
MDAVKADRARGDTMTDPSAEFFKELQQQGHMPLLKKVSGTLRFEVVNGKHSTRWFITIKRGDVTVSRQGGKADCIVKGDRSVIDGIWTGAVNPMAAVLRGEISVEGDTELLVLFQRLLPGPGASSHPRAAELSGAQS